MVKMIFFAFLLSSIAFASALTSVGRCPEDIKVVEKFDVSAYAGEWYELYRYENVNELNMDCVTANYTLRDDGLVAVHNMGVAKKVKSMIDGTAELTDPKSTEAKLTVKFPTSATPSPYWVLSTDYTSYSVVYSCTNSPDNQYVVNSWILCRKPIISGNDMVLVNVAVKSANLPWNVFRPTLHTSKACNGSLMQSLSITVAILTALFLKFF